MMAICPCCGQETDKPDVVAVVERIANGPVQRGLLLYLAENFGVWRFYKQIADSVYWLDIDGGPDDAVNSLNVIGWRLMKSNRLREAGLKLETNRKRGVRLVWND